MARRFLVAATALAGALAGCSNKQEDDWRERLVTLRTLARPAEERLARGPASDDLRARIAELDLRVQELAPPAGEVSLDEAALSADYAVRRDWVRRAWPALQPWLHSELCGTPPVDKRARESWEPLRWRTGTVLHRGERLAVDTPRLLVLRRWAKLLAWYADLQASPTPLFDVEDWELGPAEVLSSTFLLAFAHDDGSFIGTLARTSIEVQAMQVARRLYEQRAVSARPLRAAFDPWLVRSLAVRPEEILEGELRAFLVLYDSIREEKDESRDVLEFFADVEQAFELARSPAGARQAQIPEMTSTFLAMSARTLASFHRHRSITALFRVALALAARREESGTLPSQLDDLAPLFPDGVPGDPLTGKPFPYSVENGRARLGPTACPTHGDERGRTCDWPGAVESLLAWEL